jgi:hypothetical protein
MAAAAGAGNKPPNHLPTRLKRALELAYGVPGVVAARVWQYPGRIAIGVRGGVATAPASLLHHVQSAVAGLKDPGEDWEFGILGDDGSQADVQDVASAPETGEGTSVSSLRKSPRSPP